MEMTNAQTDTLTWLRAELMQTDGLRYVCDDYEYKRWDVRIEDVGYSRPKPFVILTSEIGLRCDEGTMAELLCRRVRMISIGMRGGMRLLNGKLKNVRGRAATYELTT